MKHREVQCIRNCFKAHALFHITATCLFYELHPLHLYMDALKKKENEFMLLYA